MRSPSISLRLTAWLAIIFLCGFVVFGTVMRLDLAWALSKGRDKTLWYRATRLVELLESSQADTPARLQSKFEDFQDATPEGNLIQVFNERDLRVLPAEVTGNSVPWPRVKAAEQQTFANIELNGHPFRVYTRTVWSRGRQLRIFVAGQLDDNQRLLDRFSEGLWWAIPAVMAVSTLAGYLISRRALRPIDRFIESARLISIGSLSRRLPVPNSRDEMARLAETCNEMLGRLETAVGQITRFTADASHELRSPLSFIRTVAECALRSAKVDPDNAEAFREIVSETEAASRLLEDMLTLARADAGTVPAVFEPVDLGAIVQCAADKMRHVIGGSHDFLNEIAKEPLYVMGDGSRLNQLVLILVDNAVKYTPTGGRVALSLSGTEREVCLVVHDNGVGIPASALPRIFERFFRVDPSRGQTEGVGLGLAIGKWIADTHRARIAVESEERIGTIFRVTFPRLSVADSLRTHESLVLADHP